MQNTLIKAVPNQSRPLVALALTAAAAVLFSAPALADIEVLRGGPANPADAGGKSLSLPFGLGGKPTPGATDEKFKALRAKCENEVGCGKGNGDVCAEAAALVLQENDFPVAFTDISSVLRTRIALRLLERGVDTSNLAAARAFDIYDKSDLLGIRNAAMPDEYRARELEELLTKRGYPGMALRKARAAVSILALTATAVEKTQACELAKKLKAGGKLDADSVSVANQVLTSSYCEGLEPPTEAAKPKPYSY